MNNHVDRAPFLDIERIKEVYIYNVAKSKERRKEIYTCTCVYMYIQCISVFPRINKKGGGI